MRYHWSLGIGHTYATGITDISLQSEVLVENANEGDGDDADQALNPSHDGAIEMGLEDDNAEPDPDDPELVLDERENEDLGLIEDLDELRHGEDSDDDLFEMYYM